MFFGIASLNPVLCVLEIFQVAQKMNYFFKIFAFHRTVFHFLHLISNHNWRDFLSIESCLKTLAHANILVNSTLTIVVVSRLARSSLTSLFFFKGNFKHFTKDKQRISLPPETAFTYILNHSTAHNGCFVAAN